MNTYHTVRELKAEWNTTQELCELLKKEGYPCNLDSLRRWEKAKIIPSPKRVILRKLEWRIYNKDGTDFKEILDCLGKQSRRVVKITKL